MMMAQIDVTDLRWYAVRIKRRQTGAIRTITTGGEFEAYRDRSGRTRQRRVQGTGTRVFLPEHLLRRAGFEVFLPVKKQLRRKNRFSADKHVVCSPLLADWLFVAGIETHGRWYDLMELDVVRGVMSASGRPISFGPEVMRPLMQAWGGGMLSGPCHQFLKSTPKFQRGDAARIVAGPFEGFDLRVVDVSEGSVKGIVELFGRNQQLEFAENFLGAVAEVDCKAPPLDC